MINTFNLNGAEYTVATCTAVALLAGDNEVNRQNALLITNIGESGEKSEYVVFGWGMPENIDEFADMCKDSSAWDSNLETLATVKM